MRSNVRARAAPAAVCTGSRTRASVPSVQVPSASLEDHPGPRIDRRSSSRRSRSTPRGAWAASGPRGSRSTTRRDASAAVRHVRSGGTRRRPRRRAGGAGVGVRRARGPSRVGWLRLPYVPRVRHADDHRSRRRPSRVPRAALRRPRSTKPDLVVSSRLDSESSSDSSVTSATNSRNSRTRPTREWRRACSARRGTRPSPPTLETIVAMSVAHTSRAPPASTAPCSHTCSTRSAGCGRRNVSRSRTNVWAASQTSSSERTPSDVWKRCQCRSIWLSPVPKFQAARAGRSRRRTVADVAPAPGSQPASTSAATARDASRSGRGGPRRTCPAQPTDRRSTRPAPSP